MSTCCNKCGEPHCICHIAFPSDFSPEHAASKMRDSRTIAKLEAELSATQQKLEVAEARIKASQEQEPHSRGNLGVLLYAAPVIPPDVVELQRENAELTRKLAKQQAALEAFGCPEQFGKEELTKLLAEAKSKAVPEGWQLVPKEPTEEMVIAGCGNSKDKSRWIADRNRIYKAMLASAPQPETDRGSNE